MALIKSSLEIALERAEAMMGRAEDTAKEEGRKHGQAAARRFLSGDVDGAAMAELLAARPEEQRRPALAAALEHFVEALLNGDDLAVDGLAALPLDRAKDKLAALITAARGRFQAAGQLYADLAAVMADDLARMGIGGSAVLPNPLSLPDLELRTQKALAPHLQAVQEAAQALQRAVA
ncbi:hypothetical protein [Desulfarculus baarsii]